MPQLASYQPVTAPTVVAATTVIGIAAFAVAAEPVRGIAGSAPRHLALWSLARVLATAAVGGLIVAATAAQPLCAAVTLGAVTGEGLVAASALGVRMAWVLPVTHVLAAMVFGASSQGKLAGWAWLVARDCGTPEVLASAVSLATGVFLYMKRRPSAH